MAVTKDEHLILFHDDSLERTTNVKKVFPSNKNLTFTEYTLAQIRTLNTGSRYNETDPFNEIKKGNLTKEELLSFKAQKVPTLEEALLFTKEKLWKVNLELKKLPHMRSKIYSVHSSMMQVPKFSRQTILHPLSSSSQSTQQSM